MNSPGDSSALISLQPSHLLRRNNKLGHTSYFHMHSRVTSHGEDWQGGWGQRWNSSPKDQAMQQGPCMAHRSLSIPLARCRRGSGKWGFSRPKKLLFFTWAEFWFMQADCPRTDTAWPGKSQVLRIFWLSTKSERRNRAVFNHRINIEDIIWCPNCVTNWDFLFFFFIFILNTYLF